MHTSWANTKILVYIFEFENERSKCLCSVSEFDECTNGHRIEALSSSTACGYLHCDMENSTIKKKFSLKQMKLVYLYIF